MTATVCHHNHCIHDIRFPTYDITSQVYDISSPYMWHQSHYVCEYMSTIFNIKHRVLRQYNGYMWNHNLHICICWSHRLYQWYNIHCIYDMVPTIFMAQYALYMTSHPWFMTSQDSIHYISLLYLISNWLYFTAHPLYLSHHTQITDHLTLIVCMITQVKYAWHHMNTYDITYTISDITPCSYIHTHCITLITPSIPVLASTVAELLLTGYWL